MKRDALLVGVTFLLSAVIFFPLVVVADDALSTLVIFVTWHFMIPIFVADDIAVEKDREGWPWALLLGWIGVIVVLFLPPRKIRSVAVVREDGAGQ